MTYTREAYSWGPVFKNCQFTVADLGGERKKKITPLVAGVAGRLIPLPQATLSNVFIRILQRNRTDRLIYVTKGTS